MSDPKSSFEVIKSINFVKDLKKLRKRYDAVEKDIEPLILQLEAGETPGDRITDIQYQVYKVRVKNSNARRGKSGGYRVIYYLQTTEAILLTNIYSKSDRVNISNAEIEEIEEIIEQYLLASEQQKLAEKSDSESVDLDR
jgi:mRNA-degrading endonuclease RelE of RelBE toxin-antitoxin system